MRSHCKAILAVALCAAACLQTGLAQVRSPSILTIEVENLVQYQGDTSDPSKFATVPTVVTPSTPRNFGSNVSIGDIVSVNGQPAKGTMTRNSRALNLNPAAGPGQAVGDTVRNGVIADTFEILTSNGVPVGTIIAYGPSGGAAPPGSPLAQTMGNFAIVGGTGAFLGVRGQHGGIVGSQRNTSVTEDPANRRRNAGPRESFALLVIPMELPQIVVRAGYPAVTHLSDSSLVTAYNPAVPGEILSMFVTGLGPTNPGVNPGQPFPASPVATANSPVDVTVNGASAEVLAAIGFPGAVDGYQVTFRIPPNTKGTAIVQITAAWIVGSAVGISVR